jgi:hypothetical protein
MFSVYQAGQNNMKLAQLNLGQFKIPSVPGAKIDVNAPGLTFAEIINVYLPYLFAFAGIGVLVYLVYGGYHYIIAMGDPKGLQEAKSKILNALIGFVVIFLAYWIVIILGKILSIAGWGGLFKPF